MNGRIQKLAEQAGYKPLLGFDFANSLEETYLKKFAELIIRECGAVADENYERYTPTSSQDLLHHFGIES
jgi:hypothetical protein